MQSLLLLAICTLTVNAIAFEDKLKVPVGVLYRRGEEEIVKAIEIAFSKEKHDNFSIKVIQQPYEFSGQVARKVCALLAKGITVLIASTPYTDTSNLLSSISNNHNLPFINLLASESKIRRSLYELSMMTNTVKASLNTINFYGWKSAIYVGDTVQDSGSIFDALEKKNFHTNLEQTVYQVPETIFNYMESLPKNLNKLNILLNVPLETIYDILPTLLAKYDERIAHFLITRPVTEDFWKKPFLKSILKSKITAFSMLNRTKSTLRLFSRFAEYKTEEPFLAFDASKVIFKAFSQLYNENASLVKEIAIKNTRHLSNCLINPSIPWVYGLSVSRALKEVKDCRGFSGNIQFNSLGRRRIYKLQILEASYFGTEQIGSWSDKTGLMFREPVFISSEIFPWMNSKLEEKQKKTVVITSILVEPYLMKSGDSYVGFCKDLIDILSNRLNFDYQLSIVEDGQYGSYNHSNKKWTGMIGEIISQEADLAVAPLIVTSERSKVVSFTTPFLQGGISLLAKKEYSSPSFLLFRPFSWEVWLFILIVYAIFGTFFLSIHCYISESYEKSPFMHHKQQQYTRRFLCCRSWTKFVGKFVCLIFTMALLALYIAKLSSIITNEENFYPHKEFLPANEMFEDAVKTGTPKMLLLKGGTVMKYFQKSESLLYSRYWKHIQENPDLLVSSYSEALERILLSNGDTMFLLESTFAEYISKINCNSFTTLEGTLNTDMYSIASGPTFPLRFQLNNQIMLLHVNGTLNKLYDKWWNIYSDCDESNTQRITYKMKEESLRFRDICGLFYLMIFSSIIIVILNVSQFLCHKYFKYGQEKPRKAGILT